MTTAEINLTDSQANALHALALRSGKTEVQLLHEAVEKLIGEEGETESRRQKRLEYLSQAKGIWKTVTTSPILISFDGNGIGSTSGLTENGRKPFNRYRCLN